MSRCYMHRGGGKCAPTLVPVLLFALLLACLTGCSPKRPGQRWVKDVQLRGARILDNADVLDGLETREMPWYWYWLHWIPAVDRTWYDPDVLSQDLERIETYYAAHGFFRARVTKREIKRSKNGKTVSIILTLKEGPETMVKEVEVSGLPALPVGHEREMRGALGVKEGERFDYGVYGLAKERLAARLKERGYAYARVEGVAEVHRPRRTAVIRLKVTPGPLVRFGKTRFKGNGDIPEDKLRLLVAWKEGEVYDQEKVRKTRSALFKQRVFSGVRVELPKEPRARADVTIHLQPAQLRELRLGLGFGFETERHEVRLNGRWTLRNFLGGLRVLELTLKPAFVSIPTWWESVRLGPALESEVKLTQPYLFNTRLSAFVLLGYDLALHEGYQYHGITAQAGLDYPFLSEKLWVGGSYTFQLLDFFDINEEAFKSGDTSLGFGFVDPYRPAWLEQYAELDLRDSVSDPRAGFWASVRLEEGFEYIASHFTYIKVTPEARGYIPLGTKRLVLGLRAMFGYLYAIDSLEGASLGEASSPITRRYALGGPSSHRGFSYGRLSPQGLDASSGLRVPKGGDAALLFSADLRLRVVKLWSYWLSLGAFFDAGDATAGLSDMDISKLHLAVGGGLTFATPIGALRFTVGARLNRLEEEGVDGLDNPDPGDRMAYHLPLGEAF